MTDELRDAGIAFEVRKRGGRETDIALARGDLARATNALAPAGWRRIHWRDTSHAFFVRVHEGRWEKLDAKLSPSPRRRVPALRRRALVSLRRRGPLVALVGPDGAGKSTVIAEVVSRIPLGVRVAYLGSRGSAGARSTDRLDDRPRKTRPARKSAVRETAGVLKDTLGAAKRLAREHWAAARGSIVLCDRHPKELLAVRPRRPRVAAGLERFLVRWLLPWPDAIAVLHAPAEVLHARKPEHPIERLEEWLVSYRTELGPRGATFVDTTAPQEETVRIVSELVWREVARRMGR